MYESTLVKIPSFWYGLKRPACSGRETTRPAENAAATRSARTEARRNRIEKPPEDEAVSLSDRVGTDGLCPAGPIAGGTGPFEGPALIFGGGAPLRRPARGRARRLRAPAPQPWRTRTRRRWRAGRRRRPALVEWRPTPRPRQRRAGP